MSPRKPATVGSGAARNWVDDCETGN